MTRSIWRYGLVVLLLLSACAGPASNRSETHRFDGLMRKGQAYLNRGNPQMALLALRKAQEIKPDDVVLLSQLGVAYDQLGQDAQSLIVWQRAHKLNPTSGAISHNLGVALMRQQQLVAAQKAFDAALADAKFHDRGETYFNLALIDQRNGAFREMVSGLERVFSINANHIPARQVLADHYRKMHRPDLEEVQLIHILAVDPDHLSTIERLADLHLQSNQTSRAVPLLQQIQKIAPGSEAAERATIKLSHLSGSD
ncbi:MAG: hypothetical protein HQL67_11430 [Magnetococcales bacterium]|nr:hypothetical protein [Magnetococcales bacterium]